LIILDENGGYISIFILIGSGVRNFIVTNNFPLITGLMKNIEDMKVLYQVNRIFRIEEKCRRHDSMIDNYSNNREPRKGEKI